MPRLASHLRTHLVAYLALFVALGGTSYAAVALPKNSVGAKQIKRSAVNSKKVRNGSLAAKDLSRNARSALTGARGAAGQKGAKGDKGDTGASLAGHVFGDSYVADKSPKLLLDAGKYIVFAKVVAYNGGNGTLTASCTLTNDGSPESDSTGTLTIPQGTEVNASLQSIAVLPADNGRVELKCSGPDAVKFGRHRITGLQVQRITD